MTSTTLLNDYLDWPDVGQVCQLVRETTRNGQKTIDVQYAMSSVGRDQADARRLLNWWRGQWKIENGLHWVRDEQLRPPTEQGGNRPKAVAMDAEDASRIRTGDAPQNLSAIRNSIISCFHIEKIANIAAALREYAWNPQRLFARLGKPIQ